MHVSEINKEQIFRNASLCVDALNKRKNKFLVSALRVGALNKVKINSVRLTC